MNSRSLRISAMLLFAGGLGAGVHAQEKLLKTLRMHAEQGDADAQYRLGSMYDYGLGFVQDFQDDGEAVRLYRLAAEQGYVAALVNLGVMYANGQGVMHDDVMAYVWTNVSAANGNEAAPGNINIFAKRLDRSDLRKAKKLFVKFQMNPASCPNYSN